MALMTGIISSWRCTHVRCQGFLFSAFSGTCMIPNEVDPDNLCNNNTTLSVWQSVVMLLLKHVAYLFLAKELHVNWPTYLGTFCKLASCAQVDLRTEMSAIAAFPSRIFQQHTEDWGVWRKVPSAEFWMTLKLRYCFLEHRHHHPKM